MVDLEHPSLPLNFCLFDSLNDSSKIHQLYFWYSSSLFLELHIFFKRTQTSRVKTQWTHTQSKYTFCSSVKTMLTWPWKWARVSMNTKSPSFIPQSVTALTYKQNPPPKSQHLKKLALPKQVSPTGRRNQNINFKSGVTFWNAPLIFVSKFSFINDK